jgi:hypothetical protein
MKVAACLLIMGCCAAGSVGAQSVYKWTDAQGTTHYTDQPPPAGSRASTVKLSGGAGPATQVAPIEAVRSGGGSTGASSPLAAAEAATRARNCERAKENLVTLASGAMLVDSTDPETAKRLQPFQVEEAKRKAQGEVSTYCQADAKP